MLTDLDARHLAAAQVHSAAVERTRALWAAAEKERERAAAAAQLGSDLLERVAAGDGNADDKQLLAAADAAKRQEAVADIAEAKTAAALRKQHEAQLVEIAARAAIIQSDYEHSVTRLLSIDEHIDDLKAGLEDAIAARNIQLEAVGVAYRAGHSFNQIELAAGHHRNPLLSALPSSQQPRVAVPANGISSYALKLEMYALLGNSGRRDVVFSVAPRTRLEYGRPVARDDAA